MNKINYFNWGDKYFKEVIKPTGRMILVSDPENGQDYVMGHKTMFLKYLKKNI